MLSLWTFLIHKKQFTILLTVALSLIGLYALSAVPKESAPEVQIPVGIVSVVLPGASAEDIERLVTDRIEDGLTNLENLNKLTSVSREGVSVVTVEFNAQADIDVSIQDLKDAIDTVRPELPEEANDPVVSEINFADQPILIVSISGSYTPAQLTALGDTLSDDLETVSGVSRASVSGVRERQVQVIVEKEKLTQYKIGIGDVVGALQAANNSLPVGSITVGDITYAIRFEGDIARSEDVADIPIPNRSGGAVLYVRDVAQVIDGVADAQTISRASTHGEPSAPSLTLSIFKSKGGNIVTVTDAVKKRLQELEAGVLAGASVVISIDSGKEVRRDLFELSEAGLIAIVLVMVTLFITIGWRESIVASLSIPLSFLIAFIGLWASGNTINFVSLFSLILAIGILVDSGIVITEAIHTRMKKYPPEEAAIIALREYAWPLIGGTMTTVAVFAPLFFLSGIIGEFIFTIPFTLIFVLMASLFVALGIVPLIAILFTHREMNRLEKKQEEYFYRFQNWYKHWLSKKLDSRRFQNLFLIAMVVMFFVAMLLPAFGLVKSIFFPQEDIEFAYIEIEKPEGTPLYQTDLAARQVEEMLYDSPYIESFVTTVGAGSAFNENSQSGSRVANITLLFKEDREKTSTEIVEELRKEFQPIRSSRVRVYEISGGPPTGTPIVITLSGENLNDLEKATSDAEKLLRTIPGATEIDTSIKNKSIAFALEVDKAKAASYGVTPAQIAQTLRTSINGVTATTIKKTESDIDVVVKLALNDSYEDPSETSHTTPDAIRHITIDTPQGPVLLGSMLTVSLETVNAVIRHEDRKRIESVSAYLAPGATAPEVSAAFEAKAQDEISLPSGVVMKVGGENEDIDQSFREMFFAFITGIVLMLAILVLEFNSFRHTLYLLSTIPLSMIGVMVGLMIAGQPLSFSSLLGIIALAGVIINHAIILLDSMHRIGEHETNLSLKEVVVEAAASRLRPIILTTVTTVAGMIPLISVSTLWGPLAYTIMFGLSFSTVLTLIMIPILYHRWPGKKFMRTMGTGNATDTSPIVTLPAPEEKKLLPEAHAQH